MDALVVIFVAVLAIGSLVAYVRKQGQVERSWTSFARRFGLSYDAGALLRKANVRGSVGRFAVRLETEERSDGVSSETRTRLVVSVRGRVPEDLTLGAEGLVSSVMRAIGRADVATGDAAFDGATRVGGDPIVALAVLDHATRRAVESAIRNGVTLEKGYLVWEMPGEESDLGKLESRTRVLLDVAERLSIAAGEIPGRLLAHVRSDPSTEVRRRSFEALLERYPNREETVAAARALLREGASSTRLLAAEALAGDEGREAVAAIALSEPVPDATRARAILSLARRSDVARAGPVVEAALASPAPEVCRAAIVAAGELKLARALPRLLSMADDAATGETAAALASAIGAIGFADGEGAALRLLGRDEPAVRIAAARALGKIGGRDAVEPLLALTGGLLPFGELRAAATESVRAIQARLGPGERGGLSLSDVLDAGGALSEPDAPRGGLALPRDRAGDAETA